MKKAFLWISGISFLLSVIIPLENFAMTGAGYIYFKGFSGSLFGPLFLMLLMGIFSGFFLGLAVGTKKDTHEDDMDF